MLIYNITIKVDWSVTEQWLEWMKTIHMPEVVATGCFHQHQLVKLLEVEDEGGPTYAVQYQTANLAFYRQYMERFAEGFSQESFHIWGNKVLTFSSLMEVVS